MVTIPVIWRSDTLRISSIEAERVSKLENQKFSAAYANRAAPVSESAKARRRIGGQLKHMEDTAKNGLALMMYLGAALDSEVGASLIRPTYAEAIALYLADCPHDEFLDSVTVIYNAINKYQYTATAYEWLEFATRVFDEETPCRAGSPTR